MTEPFCLACVVFLIYTFCWCQFLFLLCFSLLFVLFIIPFYPKDSPYAFHFKCFYFIIVIFGSCQSFWCIKSYRYNKCVKQSYLCLFKFYLFTLNQTFLSLPKAVFAIQSLVLVTYWNHCLMLLLSLYIWMVSVLVSLISILESVTLLSISSKISCNFCFYYLRYMSSAKLHFFNNLFPTGIPICIVFKHIYK